MTQMHQDKGAANNFNHIVLMYYVLEQNFSKITHLKRLDS